MIRSILSSLRTILVAITLIYSLVCAAFEDENSSGGTDPLICANTIGGDISFESPDVGWCRRRPTWRLGNDENTESETAEGTEWIREKCERVMGYKPDLNVLTEEKHPELSSTHDVRNAKDNYYDDEWEEDEEDDESYYQLPILERPLLKELQTCVDEILPRSTTDDVKKPAVAQLHRRSDGLVVMAVVENALNEQEGDAVLALAQCTRTLAPSTFEKREFESTGGGNDVTFLAGFLQLVVPGVAHSVHQAAKTVWEASGWSRDDQIFPPIDAKYDANGKQLSKFSDRWLPDPAKECGIRTTEHLSYDRWKGLGFHEDTESDYTVLVALSDPSEYEGGEFLLCPEYDNDERRYGGPNCPQIISVRPKKYSAIVFLSEFSHGVGEIHSPGRAMFANELWRYGDVPAFGQRPTPSMHVLEIDDLEEETYG